MNASQTQIERAAKDCYHRLRPWQKLRAEILLRSPVSLVLEDGKYTQCLESEEIKQVLAKIDEMMEMIVRDCTKSLR
jgi:hypothetical protein